MATMAYRVIAPTVTLPPSPLHGWDSLISRLWSNNGERFTVKVLSSGDSQDATWVPEAKSGGSVVALMKAGNASRGVLWDWAWDAFSDISGTPTAFPMAVGQLQFYVNTAALKAAGIADVPEWSWERLEKAITTAGPSPTKALAIGWGWANPATWRALVFGLTATLISSPVGAEDATQIVAATTRLLDMAWKANWNPTGQLGPGAASLQLFDLFAQVGWSQELAVEVTGVQNPNWHYAPLFAFMPPWTMDVLSGIEIGLQRFPPQCHVRGGCSLSPRTFPTLPVKDVVPTFAWGLQPMANSPHPDLLAEFVKWIYAPDQQRALVPLGFVPLSNDPGVNKEWQNLTKPGSTVPVFEGNRFFNPAYTFLRPDPDLGPYFQEFDNLFVSRQTNGVATTLARLGI